MQYDVLNPKKTRTELYNIASDIGEENNLATEHPEMVKELLEIMNNARTHSEIFTFSSGTYLQ